MQRRPQRLRREEGTLRLHPFFRRLRAAYPQGAGRIRMAAQLPTATHELCEAFLTHWVAAEGFGRNLSLRRLHKIRPKNLEGAKRFVQLLPLHFPAGSDIIKVQIHTVVAVTKCFRARAQLSLSLMLECFRSGIGFETFLFFMVFQSLCNEIRRYAACTFWQTAGSSPGTEPCPIFPTAAWPSTAAASRRWGPRRS